MTSVRQNPHDTDFINDPYRLYRQQYEHGPMFHWDDYGHWCVGGFDEVNAVFKDRRFGRLGGMPERTDRIANWYETERFSMLALDPPDHTQLRGLVNRAFLSRRVEQLRPRIEDLANELIDGFAGDGGVELIQHYAAPLPAIVIAEMIGLPREMAPQLLDWSNRMVRMYMFGVDAEVEADADAAADAFIEYLTGVLAERRKRPTDDLLTHLIDAEVEGERLSEPEIIATTILLLNAGHEATVHTTGNAVKTILESGREPGELFATPESTAALVEECLRYDPPLHMFARYALEDVSFGGVEFAAGDKVGLLLGSANHDPRRFERPDEFLPGRDDAGNVSFGAGIHFCIGAPLARIELQTSLALLFERLPGLQLDDTPEYRDIFHFHGLDTLNVSW